MITQMTNVCNQNEHDMSKTLTIAIQSEMPIKYYLSVKCFSSNVENSRFFIIPSLWLILNKTFLENHFSRNTFKFLTSKISFTHSFKDQTRSASVTTPTEKKFLSFSFIFQSI